MAWAFVPYLGGISFILAGRRAGERSWQIIGWVMLTSLPLAIGLDDTESPQVDPHDFVMAFMTFVWIGGAIAVFPLRSAYEKRLATAEPDPESEPRRVEAADASASPPPDEEETERQLAAAGLPGGVVDLNRASAEEIASLPGMDASMAERAVGYREGRGGFSDLSDFAHAVKLQPHEVERLRDSTTIEPLPSAPPQDEDRGRVLDL